MDATKSAAEKGGYAFLTLFASLLKYSWFIRLFSVSLIALSSDPLFQIQKQQGYLYFR